MAAFVSYQETAKVSPKIQTLHERMCFIADDIVRYNFSDVAVHDARILKKMQIGEARLWMIHELGSQFLPLCSKINDWRAQQRKDVYLCSVEVMMARLLRTDPLQKAQNKAVLDSAKYFIVVKGESAAAGKIEPIEFSDVINLVFRGKADSVLKEIQSN